MDEGTERERMDEGRERRYREGRRDVLVELFISI